MSSATDSWFSILFRVTTRGGGEFIATVVFGVLGVSLDPDEFAAVADFRDEEAPPEVDVFHEFMKIEEQTLRVGFDQGYDCRCFPVQNIAETGEQTFIFSPSRKRN